MKNFKKQVLKALNEILGILQTNKAVASTEEDDELRDGVDLEKYLKCCRRTIYIMRKNGLPFIQKENRRIYY